MPRSTGDPDSQVSLVYILASPDIPEGTGAARTSQGGGRGQGVCAKNTRTLGETKESVEANPEVHVIGGWVPQGTVTFCHLRAQQCGLQCEVSIGTLLSCSGNSSDKSQISGMLGRAIS